MMTMVPVLGVILKEDLNVEVPMLKKEMKNTLKKNLFEK